MATKLYNSHLNKILFECNEYYILDTYISLVHMSSEVNNKYLIQSYSNSKSDIVALVKNHCNASYKTIYNCIEKLISLNILKYDESIFSWVLVDMELMTKSKSEGLKNISEDLKTVEERSSFTGYTHIRKFFFSDEFTKMKAREKRLMIYMSQLSDSKASTFHNEFSMNLLKPNSSWLKVLKTKCKYYAKYTIENMLSKYKSIFINKTTEFRSKDLSPKRNKNFKFLFDCLSIKNKEKENENFELVKLTNAKEYLLVMDKIKFAKITLSKQKIMHLIRSISNLKEWFLKERVTQIIINKYIAIQIHNSRDNIKSLPAYAAAVVRSVVNEYKSFKENISLNKVRKYEIGEYFMHYIDNDSSDNLSKEIEYSLSLI
ncbi:hypothetical protein DVW12_16215 [Clostridium botulinum]|nr:hypothetical protein [Clostridium botulinum]